MLLGLGHTHVEVSSVDIRVVSDLAIYEFFFCIFLVQNKGPVSITMFECQSFDMGT